MISHPVVAEGNFLPQLHVCNDYGLRIECAEHDFLLIVAPFNEQPHLLRLTRPLVGGLELDVIASLVFAHRVFLHYSTVLCIHFFSFSLIYFSLPSFHSLTATLELLFR